VQDQSRPNPRLGLFAVACPSFPTHSPIPSFPTTNPKSEPDDQKQQQPRLMTDPWKHFCCCFTFSLNKKGEVDVEPRSWELWDLDKPTRCSFTSVWLIQFIKWPSARDELVIC